MLDERWQQHIASTVAHWSEISAESIRSSAESIRSSAAQHERPSAIYRPSLSIDGDQWCALYGDNLQDGVAGFGLSPAAAMEDFDRNFSAAIKGSAA